MISSCLGQITHSHTRTHARCSLIEYLLFLCLGLWFCQFYTHIHTHIYIEAAVIVCVYVLCCAFIFSHFLIKIFNDFARAHGLNKRTQTQKNTRPSRSTVCLLFLTYIHHAPIIYTYVWVGRGDSSSLLFCFPNNLFICYFSFHALRATDVLASPTAKQQQMLFFFSQRNQLLLYTVIQIHKIPMLILIWAVHTENC